MKKLMLSLFLLPAVALGGGTSVHLDEANIDITDEAALQRGAKYFVNYCHTCHSADYMRYGKLMEIGLNEPQIKQNLMFAGEKIGDTMGSAMGKQDAEVWFGAPPPDLTLIARLRGADWLYSYMRAFYLDPSRPLGVNNIVFPDVGMSHPLWELQGLQKAVFEEETDEHGNTHEVFKDFEMAQPGTMTPGEYDDAVRDLVTFLAWMGEPNKVERQRLGIWVLLFLGVFLVISYLLKKEYWKDIH